MYNDRLGEAKIKYLHFYDMKYAVLGKCMSNKDILADCFVTLPVWITCHWI